MNSIFMFHEPEEAKTAEEMRKAIFGLLRDDNLVRAAFDMADYNGLSGEDKYTILAYTALRERAYFGNKVLRFASLSPTPPNIIIKENPNDTTS